MFIVSCVRESSEESDSDNYGNKPHRKEWLKDAGFGMFVHFGIDSQLGTVISHSLVNATDSYVQGFFTELPAHFNPENFDPQKLALLAKQAGMKILISSTVTGHGIIQPICCWRME